MITKNAKYFLFSIIISAVVLFAITILPVNKKSATKNTFINYGPKQIKMLSTGNICPLGKTLSQYEGFWGKGEDISDGPINGVPQSNNEKRYRWITNGMNISGYWHADSSSQCKSFSIFFEDQSTDHELPRDVLEGLLKNSLQGYSWGKIDREWKNPNVRYVRSDGASFGSGPQIFFGGHP
jgi:hypothetical protein